MTQVSTARSEEEMVAYALEAPIALLRHIPELLADLQELGSNAEAIVDVLAALRPTESATVVDLGCGKGAVAVGVAKNLNLKVLGIDLFKPFVEHCEELACSQNVSGLCEFMHGNILTLSAKLTPFDIAIYAALGDVLGPLDQTISIIRQYVKPGGYLVISDGFIKDGGSSDFAGFEQYADHDTMIARLAACGDTLVREIIRGDACDEKEGALITARAKAIATRQPNIADDVLAYAEMQVAEYEYIDRNFESAIWVLKRSH